MVLLYGRHYNSRYRAISDLIPDNAIVLDLCCGPALLFHRYLRDKSVRYTGLDINEKFIARLIRSGGAGEVWDLRSERELPNADYVIMQASLYHFLPDASAIVNRMLKAARKNVIIAEPVRNLTSSSSSLLSFIGRAFTNPGSGEQASRFDQKSLAEFFDLYRPYLSRSFPIAGGREVVYVLDGQLQRSNRVSTEENETVGGVKTASR
jgi:SAM-dependent methyltransferase